jgi:hypothetical protein
MTFMGAFYKLPHFVCRNPAGGDRKLLKKIVLSNRSEPIFRKGPFILLPPFFLRMKNFSLKAANSGCRSGQAMLSKLLYRGRRWVSSGRSLPAAGEDAAFALGPGPRIRQSAPARI